MKDIFKIGDQKKIAFCVSEADVASFHGEVVHAVCATFALAREIEWATRQYVLEMREDDEEGVGTYISIDHQRPAFVGEEVSIESKIEMLEGNTLICSYTVICNDEVIATGKTGQKIVKREKLEKVFSKRGK